VSSAGNTIPAYAVRPPAKTAPWSSQSPTGWSCAPDWWPPNLAGAMEMSSVRAKV